MATTAWEHLFDVQLQYHKGYPRVREVVDQGRWYLGSGDGAVKGAALEGTVCWDLFEHQGPTRCDARLTGLIETREGAMISFDAVGWLRRKEVQAQCWHLVAGVSFETEAEPYRWLNEVLASWVGVFDMESYRHVYRAYLPRL